MITSKPRLTKALPSPSRRTSKPQNVSWTQCLYLRFQHKIEQLEKQRQEKKPQSRRHRVQVTEVIHVVPESMDQSHIKLIRLQGLIGVSIQQQALIITPIRPSEIINMQRAIRQHLQMLIIHHDEGRLRNARLERILRPIRRMKDNLIARQHPHIHQIRRILLQQALPMFLGGVQVAIQGHGRPSVVRLIVVIISGHGGLNQRPATRQEGQKTLDLGPPKTHEESGSGF